MDNKIVPTGLYGDPNIGTESVSSEDLNTPVLKIIQKTTEGAENMKIGSYLLPDGTQETAVAVNLVFVSTEEGENYNKTGTEKRKVYYGFFSGTNNPFKMYVRGWGMAQHRDFQTEVMNIKNTYKVPMLALEVTLSTEKQEGTIAATGKPYTTYKPVFTITKDVKGVPMIENDKERISFLIEASNKFKNFATESENDESQNLPWEEKIDMDGIDRALSSK